jgi:predicted RNase H-like HicB family nuclease
MKLPFSSYPVGFPFWRSHARSGGVVTVLIEVREDSEAGVFYVAGSNLDGLAAEGATLGELRTNCDAAIDDLLSEAVHVEAVGKRMRLDFAPA